MNAVRAFLVKWESLLCLAFVVIVVASAFWAVSE